MYNDLGDIRAGLAEKQARAASVKWYFGVAALPAAGIFAGLIWALVGNVGSPAAAPGQLVAENRTAMPSPDLATLQAGRKQAASPLISGMVSANSSRAEREASEKIRAAGFDEVNSQIDLYHKTTGQLSRCVRYHRETYGLVLDHYRKRNAAAFDSRMGQLRRIEEDTRLRMTDELSLMKGAIDGSIAESAMAQMAFVSAELSRPGAKELSATDCARFKNEVQSGRHNLKPVD